MARRGGAGEVVDLVHVQPQGLRDIVPHQFEIGHAQQVRNVRLLAGKEIVQADDVVSGLNEALAKMRAQEAGAAGNENALDGGQRQTSLS